VQPTAHLGVAVHEEVIAAQAVVVAASLGPLPVERVAALEHTHQAKAARGEVRGQRLRQRREWEQWSGS
jgi:hypothetical protein